MKIDDVPQDNEPFKGKSNVHKLLYVTDSKGKYTQVNSEGWEVENLATKQAWEAVEEELQEIYGKVKSGSLSPVAYYMKKNLLEISVLAKYLGLWKWQVKRHMNPKVFKSLPEKILLKYANVFNVSMESLKNLPNRI